MQIGWNPFDGRNFKSTRIQGRNCVRKLGLALDGGTTFARSSCGLRNEILSKGQSWPGWISCSRGVLKYWSLYMKIEEMERNPLVSMCIYDLYRRSITSNCLLLH